MISTSLFFSKVRISNLIIDSTSYCERSDMFFIEASTNQDQEVLYAFDFESIFNFLKSTRRWGLICQINKKWVFENVKNNHRVILNHCTTRRLIESQTSMSNLVNQFNLN